MLFISTSGALGRYIDLPVHITIDARALLAFFALWLYCKYRKIVLRIAPSDRFLVLFSGVLMGLHWMTYFYALQLSNVAIGMLSLFTYPMFTAFLEPLILKTKFQRIHLALGALVLLGIYFLVPDFDIKNEYTMAVGLGMLSALFYALRNIVMKRKVSAYNGSMLMCYQSAVVGLVLLPGLFFFDLTTMTDQWPAIVTLAVLTTAVGHTLFLRSFKNFSITTASIISSVQPVYGILIGALFLNEIPALSTVIGGLLILSAVVAESLLSYRRAGQV
ncbi:DMT family transporter [Maribacter sp. 2307UL18-2]|uniref:DMT family transporter n=1 Tax=Maribacter sp. 2307UL18-2 TaxID=3386274 RepID=UPI0039BCFDE1